MLVHHHFILLHLWYTPLECDSDRRESLCLSMPHALSALARRAFATHPAIDRTSTTIAHRQNVDDHRPSCLRQVPLQPRRAHALSALARRAPPTPVLSQGIAEIFRGLAILTTCSGTRKPDRQEVGEQDGPREEQTREVKEEPGQTG